MTQRRSHTARWLGHERWGSGGVCRALALIVALLAIGCLPPSTWTGTSPDHRSRYTVSEIEGLTCIRLDERTPRCYEGLSLQDITFAPDGRRLAFPARVGDAWRVVVGEETGPPVQGVGEIVFSPDGTRLAYAALREGSWYVVDNGRFGPAVDAVYAGSLRFDASGRRLVYAARSGASSFVSLNGRGIGSHEGVGAVGFSPSGSRLGYVARDGGRAHLIVDGRIAATHREVLDFAFAPDGASIAWVSREADGSRVHWQGLTYGPFPTVTDLTLPPSAPPAFVVRADGSEQLRRGDRDWAWHDYVEPPVFAERGPRWGYIGTDSTEAVVILDGRVHARERWAAGLRIDAQGRRFAYVAQRAGLVYVVHDTGERGFDVILPETLLFLADGTRWACLAGDLDREELYVVVEGTSRTRPFDWSEAGRLMLRQPEQGSAPDGVDALRSWVAAEAALILQEDRGRQRRPSSRSGRALRKEHPDHAHDRDRQSDGHQQPLPEGRLREASKGLEGQGQGAEHQHEARDLKNTLAARPATTSRRFGRLRLGERVLVDLGQRHLADDLVDHGLQRLQSLGPG